MAVLIHSSSIGGIKDELRILFETCVSSKFILYSDKSEDSADAYWIEYWVNKKKMCELFLSEKYKGSHSFYKDILENQSSIDDLKNKLTIQMTFLKSTTQIYTVIGNLIVIGIKIKVLIPLENCVN